MANVGNFPGVPALLTGFSAALSVTQNPIVQDVLSGLGISLTPKWGIYLNARPVIVADTVIDMSYKQDWVIADYPIEGGGFVSYDKVATPFEARVRFVTGSGGSNVFNLLGNAQRTMLDSIAAIAGDTQLYDVVTPTATYNFVNVRHYDYHRSVQNGLGVLAVDVWLSQIRVTSAASLTAGTVAPSGAAPIVSGQVPTTTATPAQTSAWTTTVTG